MKALKISLRATRSVKTSYVLGFLLGLHMALPAYIHSTFLSQFLPEGLVGVIFSLASMVTIITFAYLPRLLRKIGNYKATLIFLALSGGSAASLALSDLAPALIMAFIVSYTSVVVLTFNHDLFLEHSSADRVTGEIRGTYLFFINIAWVLAQVGASYILVDSQYRLLFLLTSLITLPMAYIAMRAFENFKDRKYESIPLVKLERAILKHRGVASAYALNFLLQFFFSWMIIYTPLYLHNHIGFSWSQTTLMFAIMLVPFVLLERPLGKLADRLLGEKELLFTGFVIMALSTAAMTFLSAQNIVVWTLLLFMSRVGASMVEVMSETYFFKKVSDRDATLIGLFRTTRPWAYVVAPLIASMLLLVVGLEHLFIVLGIIMLFGATVSLFIEDTL